MQDASTNNSIVSGVSYFPSNQIHTMTYSGITETRTYNNLWQLTNITAGTLNAQYNYTAGSNNGKITSSLINGETVMYQYDALNRMIQASSSAGWSGIYSYDGFGNLTKSGNGGPPGQALTADPLTNCIHETNIIACDANGNEIYNGMLYDAENRLVTPPGAPTTVYAYDAQNKRFFTWPGTYDPVGDGNPSGYRVSLYSPTGQRLGTYEIDVINIGSNFPNLTLQTTLTSSDMYFGSRRLAVQDRLGSSGSYYPYGEARTGTNPMDTWSFATYWRDPGNAGPGLDYADQRYYSNQFGRFMTPDPYSASAALTNPQSWNRYTYAQNDPVNYNDPAGLLINSVDNGDPFCGANWIFDASLSGPCGFGYWGGIIGGTINKNAQARVKGLDILEDLGFDFSIIRAGANLIFQVTLPESALGSYLLSPGAVPVVIELGLGGGPIVEGAVTIAITVYALAKLYQYLSSNPAVDAPWKSFPELEKELKNSGKWTDKGNGDWEADCPPGSKRPYQSIHLNEPDQYHQFKHYDWVDCDGKSWSVWGDGTMTPNK